MLRKAEHGLQDVADSPSIVENKHILAYVSGLGFGVMSGAFALVNILADSVRFVLLLLYIIFGNYFIIFSASHFSQRH